MSVTNWAGNVVFGARTLHRPSTVAEVQDLVAAGGPLRVLGSGHSFNRMADTDGDLLSVAGLPRLAEISADRTSVRIDGGVRYGELAVLLQKEGLALHNLASLPHISVAGAIASATHGSGVRNGNLATAVSRIEFVDGTGKQVSLGRGDEGFEGAVVHLGALGVVTSLTLDVLPDFQVRQYVYDSLPRTQVDAHLDEIMADGYSVSLFTDWTSVDVNHVWLKRLDPMSGDWFGAHPADGPRHPVPGMPATNSTEQGGVPGPWHLRLPHFRMEFTPSAGEELQSEYHIARENGLAAFQAVSQIRERVAPVLQVSEIRTIAADELWMSPNYRRDTLALHFTWIADTDAVLPVVADVEAALAPFDPRPHWGKVFTTNPETLRTQYERFTDFQSLVRRYDPDGVFRNEWQDAILGARP